MVRWVAALFNERVTMNILEYDFHTMSNNLMNYHDPKQVMAILQAECKGRRRRSFIARIISRYAELKRLEAIKEAEKVCRKHRGL